MTSPPALDEIIDALRRSHGKPARPRVTDPFEMVLLENAAYLVDDARRAEVFARLEEQVGCEPEAILDVPVPALAELIRDGGMHPERRAAKLHAAAEIMLDIGRTELRAAMRREPARAKRLLKRFPGLGEPGAERVLLFNRAWKGLAPDSNALRVLVRLGFGKEQKDYGKTYRSVADAVEPQLPDDPAWLIQAHQLLQMHGRSVCKNKSPKREECAVADRCVARRWSR